MSSDTAIIDAEKRMGINRFANPYFVQLILTGFFLGPIGIGVIVSRIIPEYSPSLAANAANDGWAVTALLWIIVAAYGLKTFQIANSSKWFELSYCGDESDVDWMSSFRMAPKPAIDLGEAIPLPPPPPIPTAQGEPKVETKLGIPWKSRFIEKPKYISKGHCWQLNFLDKHLPHILVWLPSGYDFETCCNFAGHEIQAFFRGFPFLITDGTKATFLRTSYVPDPDGTIIPTGIFTHFDLRTKLLRRDIEPLEAPPGEVRALAQTRDNYYRQEVTLELELVKKQNKRLETQVEKADDYAHELAAGLVEAMKGRHKKEPEKIKLAASRKQQVLIIGVVTAILVLSAVAALYSLGHH